MHLQKIGHADPHEGFSGDVFGHLGYAYLSSWPGPQCRADGVRVYDVHTPSNPKRVSTFANVTSQEKLRRTWTEKTIVQHASTASFTGELAVVSVQGCGGNTFAGFGLYDVTQSRQAEGALARPSRAARLARDLAADDRQQGVRLYRDPPLRAHLLARLRLPDAARHDPGQARLPHLRRQRSGASRAGRRMGRVEGSSGSSRGRVAAASPPTSCTR